MTRTEILQRARKAATESKARYKLGKGGYDPSFPLPEKQGVDLCDCSGFFSWAIGEKRQNERMPGGWIETSAVHRDASGDRTMFEQIETPEPGDGIVYPDRKGKQGHIGIISAVKDGKVKEVIHCSAGNDRRFGKAIAATGPQAFTARKDSIYVRPVEPVPPSPNEKDCTP